MRSFDKAIFLCLFFLSGACGLTYEIVWSRLLVFVFGGTTFAITTVLTCFMGGLAFGSWLAGRLSERRASHARPERLYGVLEIVIGLTALLVPLLMELSTGLYRALVDAIGGNFLLITVARVAISAVILLLPTTAMGATLPLLTSAFTRRGAALGGNVAALYGANTFGAFVGCAGAGFFLLPRLGLSSSTLTVALLNLVAGVLALLLSLRPDVEPQDAAQEVPEGATEGASEETAQGAPGNKKNAAQQIQGNHGPNPRTILLLYGLSGFAAMAYQVAWTRALILSMGSSTYSFSTIVSCYIFGLATGSLLMTRYADKVRQPVLAVGLLQATIALSALFVVPFFGQLPTVVAHATALEGATFGSVLFLEAAWVFGLLIVPTLSMGALLPLVCRIYDPASEKAGRSVGDVYAANTTGGILGAALAGFVLIPLSFVGMERTIQGASMLNLLIGTFFLLAQAPQESAVHAQKASHKKRHKKHHKKEPHKTGRYVLVGGAWLLAIVAVLVTDPWSRDLMTSGPYLGRSTGGSTWDLVFYREGIDATVSVERSKRGEVSLSVNGKADASTLADDMQTQILAGVLPMLQRPEARQVCLIGLGSGVTAGSILAFDVDRLDLAEISQGVVEGSRFFDDTSRAPLDDPRLEMHRADGRNFLLLNDRQYDVIVSEPSNPWISGIANLFTREFFELSKSRLNPGGIHAQWLHGYSMDPDNFAAVLHTLEEVFGHVQIWEMALNDYLFLASTEALTLDAEGLFFSFSRPALQGMLEEIRITSPLQIAHHYVGEAQHLNSWLANARLLTDDLPHLEFSAPRFLLTDTEGPIAEHFLSAAGTLRFVDDPNGVLEQRLLAVAETAKKRGKSLLAAQEAQKRGDRQGQADALVGALDATSEDIRAFRAVLIAVRSLADAGVPAEHLEEGLRQVREDSWPFARHEPWPMPAALAYAGRRLVDEGGDLREATAHLLRAWLRSPSDGQVIYDLARAYAARGEVERVLWLLDAAAKAGFEDSEAVANETLFDPFRKHPGFPH